MADKKEEKEEKEDEVIIVEEEMEDPVVVEDAFVLEELEALKLRNAELLDALQRLKAEFDNYRKRMVKEQTRILETAESSLIKKLLPAMDNLDRALESAPGSEETKQLEQGVSLVRDHLLETLEKEGLEVVEGQGEPFDPEEQEAVMVVPGSGKPEGTVVDVTQKGYRFNGILLRPAMVTVAGEEQ